MIGIYCDYGFNETTDSVLSLSQYLTKQAESVTIASRNKLTTQVDSFWDKYVQRVKTVNEFILWKNRCDKLIWYALPQNFLDCCDREQQQHFYVCSWHKLEVCDLAQLHNFDAVVTPDNVVNKWLSALCPQLKISNIPWSCGLPVRRRETTYNQDKIQLFLPLRADTAKTYGALIFYALQAILDLYPAVTLILAYSKYLPPTAYTALQELLHFREKRIKIYYRPTRQEYQTLCWQSDWTLCLDINSDFGVTSLNSFNSGTPVMGLDVPVISSTTKSKEDGCLIGCDIADSKLKVPTAVLSIKHLLDGLKYVLDSKLIQADIRGQAWLSLEDRQRLFSEGWKQLLN